MSTLLPKPRRELRGFSIVPLLTPFRADRSLDEDAAGRLVDHVVNGGCQALMIGGTTGEGASMPVAMRIAMFRLALRRAEGRALVFAGIGDNSFDHSVALADAAFALGAYAVVGQLPSYYAISPAEMETYFRALADRVPGPMYLYNIPQTTHASIPLDVIERLSTHPRIAGLKDSEPDARRQEGVAARFARREDFAVFCGSIAFTAAAMRAGADGFVPSVGNIAPRLTRQAMDQWMAGGEEAAAGSLQKMAQLAAVYQKGRSLGESLSALKGAIEAMGLGSRHMLPPLRDCSESEIAGLRAELRQHSILP